MLCDLLGHFGKFLAQLSKHSLEVVVLIKGQLNRFSIEQLLGVEVRMRT